VFPIRIPALRERGRDVGLLADAFARRFAKRMGKRIEPLSDDQLKLLRGYDWPGNVRELQNVIERAIILSSSPRLELERAMTGTTASPDLAASSGSALDRIMTVDEMLELERANIIRALAAAKGKVSGEDGAARLVGIPPSTFSSRMKALGIEKLKG
jgi:transcriptional regulator with GAF, ATPase, and Fis domain